MIGFANAKINLGLFITEKRDDGFHNLETIFYPIALHDVIEFIPSESQQLELHTQGIQIPGQNTDNLILKSYQLLSKEFDLPPLQINLIKNIPTGAGLGGGSSDGARMLQMLNDYFQLNIHSDKLMEYASTLGSDCAFFILNQPCFASGRGEILQPVNLDLSGYSLHLIHPGIHISTKEAFAKIKPKPSNFDLKNLMLNDISSWKDIIRNDFEESVFPQYPELSEIKQTLYREGAVYASMSGSGSAMFGIFPPEYQKRTIDLPSAYLSIHIQL